MPEVKFTAGVDAAKAFLTFVFSETDCRVYETYSEFDRELREFRSVAELAAAFTLSVGAGEQFSLWSPAVMSTPNIKRIELKVKGHQFRYGIEGCGLFSLLLGDARGANSLSYWSEAGARQRCSVQPGPDAIDWAAHKRLGHLLSGCARRVANEL